MIFADILKEIDSNWSIRERARKIYTRMAQEITYDDRFSFFTDKKLLEEIYFREIDIDKDEETTMVCNPANKTYMNLLNRCGIKAELIYKPAAIKREIEVPDVSCVFYDENDLPIYTNITGDLTNCKFGLKTQFFGINKSSYKDSECHTTIEDEELETIDRKIKYIKHDYSDIVFKLILEEVKNTNHFKKFLESQGIDTKNMGRDEILKNKMQYITRLVQFRNKTAGSFERKQFYKKLFHGSVLDKFDSKKFSAYEFVKNNDEKLEHISCIEIELQDSMIYFAYSDKEEKYVQVEVEKLKELTKGYREVRNKKMKFIQSEEEHSRI